MAAGLGFKDFTTGEVLTAADVDGYLMQGIWVFASAAARDAAVTSPQEGNFAFLKDTNTTTYYTGSAWTNLDTTGMVNPMTTTGDTIYSSSGSTPARLGIGSTGQVLTVAGGVPTWAAASSGALSLISATTFSASSAHNVNDVFSSTYDNYLIVLNLDSVSADDYLNLRVRVSGSDLTSGNYNWSFMANGSGGSAFDGGASGSATSYRISYMAAAGTGGSMIININNPYLSKQTNLNVSSVSNFSATSTYQLKSGGSVGNTTSYTGFTIFPASGNITGKVAVYGYSI